MSMISKFFSILLFNSIDKYIKRLLGIPLLYIKERTWTFNKNLNSAAEVDELLEKFNNKRSELKYLSNFRKRNQTRFYD